MSFLSVPRAVSGVFPPCRRISLSSELSKSNGVHLHEHRVMDAAFATLHVWVGLPREAEHLLSSTELVPGLSSQPHSSLKMKG